MCTEPGRSALAAGAVLALGCATAGVVLSILPTGVSVAMTATTYRIGDATLHAVAPGVYSGSGTLVLGHSGPTSPPADPRSSTARAGSRSARSPPGGAAETCRLQSGTRTLSAHDVWSAGTWHRTYSDGVRVEIAAARGVPVPFPVGR